MIDANLLNALLRSDSYAGLSDADAAALASVPILTARAGKVTFTTLGSVWGLERAVQFKAQLKGLAASATAAAPVADYAIAILAGDGFDPGHPEAAKAGAIFVQAGIATPAEIRDSQFTTTFPAGDVVTAENVAAARASVSREDAADAAFRRSAGKWNTYVGAFEAWRQSGFAGDGPGEL